MEKPTESQGPPADDVALEDNVTITLRGPDGEIKQQESVHNLVTTVGAEAIAEQLLAAPGVATPGYMAIGTSSTAAAVGQTALVAEVDRNALTSKTRSAKVVTYKAKWEPGDGTGKIQEAGLFSANVAGTMYNRAVFGAIEKEAGDTLELVWTTTVG